MAIKKYIVVAFIVFMLLTSYLYLVNKYNIKTVEYGFAGDLTYSQFEDLRKSTKSLVKKGAPNKELICVVNYVGSYNGNRLIMTTGFDNLIKHIPILKGNYISDNQVREAAIGDRAADRLFRSINVVGQTLNVGKQEYKITGIINDSDDLYISFDESSNISWSKKNIKFIIENQKYLYLYTEMLEGKLRIMNLEVLDRVIYKQGAYLYINIIIVMFVLMLTKATKKQINKIVMKFKETCGDYQKQSRRVEAIQYLRKHMNDILQIGKDLSFTIICLAAIIKCVSFLQLPPQIVPSNLFAISSYIDIIKQNVHNYFYRLDYGINGITLDNYIISLVILVAIIGMLFYTSENKQYEEKTNKIDN